MTATDPNVSNQNGGDPTTSNQPDPTTAAGRRVPLPVNPVADQSHTHDRPHRTSPFPIPYGWFQVAYPSDIPVGGVVPLRYFDRDLVAWRDEEGTAHLWDAYCPHLGAHLGVGGHVEGCELMCPFHGWKFGTDGTNTDIPYSERVNRKARIRTYPVLERNGLTMAWYHPLEGEPEWEIPEIAEYDDDDFIGYFSRDYVIHSPWQELSENTVDAAHFRYVHGTDTVPEIESYEADGVPAKMRSLQKFVTPRGVQDARIDVDNWGPGFSVTMFSGIVDATLLGTTCPIDDATIHLRFNFLVRSLGDENMNSTLVDAFVAEINKQVVEDIPVWENKAYLERPALADTDGPFTKFRKWAATFYVDEPTAG